MLFDELIESKGTEKDNTDITTTLLYFSTEELNKFKRLCKSGMMKEWGEERFSKGNISDLLLIALNKLYAENNG